MYCDTLYLIPFVRMVAVCNNLAFSSVDEESDIDLFIVAKEGRLFFVRTFATVLFHLLGVRRHGTKVAGRFCLSFYVDDSSLDLSPLAIEDDLYLAHWVRTMTVVIDDGVSGDFFDSNFWVRSFLEAGADLGVTRMLDSSVMLDFFRSILTAIFCGSFGDYLERFFSRWQLARALRKRSYLHDPSGIVVNNHVLKFHNVDRRAHYRDLWRGRFGDKKITFQDFRELCS